VLGQKPDHLEQPGPPLLRQTDSVLEVVFLFQRQNLLVQ